MTLPAGTITGTADITALVQTAYDQYVRMALRSIPVMRAIADVKPVQQAMPGSSVVFSIYSDLSTATGTLTETSDVSSIALGNPSQVTVTLQEYGSAVTTTKKLNLTSFNDVDAALADIIAYNAADSIDSVVASVLTGGTNVIYAGTGNTTTSDLTTGDTITVANIRKAVTELRTNKAVPRMGELYVAYLHPRQAADLRAESGTGGFQDIVKYTDNVSKTIIPGAVGFMYARTQSPAPSNGPYAKKTKASAQNGMEMSYYQHGLDFKPKTISQDGIAIDPMGYWNPENVGGPVIIPSTDITMQGVDQPLIGISNTGDTQYMEPGNNYMFDGDYVTEYPMARKGISVNEADAQPLKKLDQLLNFTNYNDMAKAKHGKTHKKAQVGKELPRIQLPKIPGTWEGLTPPISSTPTATANKFNPAKAIPVLGKVIEGIQNIKAQKEKYREAKQQTALTDVMSQAAASRPVQQPRRQYVRPEDMIFQPEQMSPSYGVGTNVLAQDGAMIGGTPTEIQNIIMVNLIIK